MNSFKLVGTGKSKVLVLPGMLGDQDSFDSSLQYADLKRFQYAVFDYRGYGRSLNLGGLFTMIEAATDASRLTEYLGWETFSIVAHSMGALVGQILAQARPQRVDRLVSLAGVTAAGVKWDEQRRAAFRKAATDVDVRAQIVLGGTSNRVSRIAAQRVAAASFQTIAPEAFAGYATSLSQTRLDSESVNSSLSYLSVIGEHDPGNTEQSARDVTARLYPSTEIVLLRDCGHYPMLEMPMRTQSLIEGFIGS